MSCLQTISDYGLRSLGYGQRLLPKGEITLCEQVVLIGSGMIWNIYFAVLAIVFGFLFATFLALCKASRNPWYSVPASSFVYLFRGTPLFIQFFFTYELFVLLPKVSADFDLWFAQFTIESRWLTRAWLGALIVLFLNTSAYSAEIFYGALKSVPKGEIEAAEAIGMNASKRFRRIIWPTMLRLAWPSYTNEAIFLFHATALIFFASFPAWQQKGDALYYANYFAEKTFNPFVAYPISGAYFVAATLVIIWVFGRVNRQLNSHLAPGKRSKVSYKPNFIR